ncbi:MAG: cytochrome C oxidase subunit IV family protein [Planctomycetes bacterium]|nr:cytochrome C oxidase subunit IV family protein [Planctomycetota bacterium]
MEDHTEHHPNYVLIWFILVILTIISILIGKYIDNHVLKVTLLFVNAAIKAVLVALNFMHLKFEKVVVISLVVVPLTLFILLIFGLMPDTLSTIKW